MAYGSLHAVLPLLEHLEAERVDGMAILDRIGIPRSAREDPRTRLPQDRFDALWREAVEATGDPALALRASTRTRPSTLGIIGALASASRSRRDAFELVRGLTPLLWENFQCDLESDGEVAFMRFSAVRGRLNRFTIEYAVGLTVAMSRSLGAAASDPLEARFSYPAPAHAEAYERILRLPVRFDAEADGVLFPISLLDRSNPSADAALMQLLERYASDQLARIPGNLRLPDRVRGTIRSLIPPGKVDAEGVAARLSMSERTMRRRLRDDGTSYREVLDEVRAELARRYLGDEARGIEEAAHLLGFADTSAFSKAFRRWTGRSPAAWARAHALREARWPDSTRRATGADRPQRLPHG